MYIQVHGFGVQVDHIPAPEHECRVQLVVAEFSAELVTSRSVLAEDDGIRTCCFRPTGEP